MNDTTKAKKVKNVFFDLRQNAKISYLDLAGYWSYPAFVRHPNNEIYWLYLILPTVRMPKKKLTALFRPKSALITRANSKTVVRYDNFRLGHDPFPKEEWNKPKDTFPHKSIGGLTRYQLQQKEINLLKMCVEESSQFGENGNLSETFRSSWLELTHPVFLLYLKHLAPEFFKVLRVENID